MPLELDLEAWQKACDFISRRFSLYEGQSPFSGKPIVRRGACALASGEAFSEVS